MAGELLLRYRFASNKAYQLFVRRVVDYRFGRRPELDPNDVVGQERVATHGTP